ncbi:MAG: TIGR02453 family protein [Thalassobius sp.]|nr:TIGR02453 family protein [Thalassovita sp.]
MKNILSFLSALQENNNKEWMDANKPEYQAARKTFMSFVTELIQKTAAFDPTITGLLAKDCVFRINRDIRFSNDKRPYKTNMGAFIASGGKKTKGAGYYIHLQPENCFIGGGIYMPAAPELAKIRQEIDYNAPSLIEILSEDKFKNTFGEMDGDKLKTAPKGYPKDHPHIELLRLKSFTVFTKVPESEVTQEAFLDNVAAKFKVMYPFNNFLNTAVAEVEE